MGTIARGNKAAGGTDFVDGTDALASEVNTDLNTIVTEFNGSIEDVNVGAAAAIDPTKLDDFSATATEAATTADPGESGSESLATDMSDELERIRYVIQRLAIGSATVVRTDSSGATTAYWGDLPMQPSNRMVNPVFNFDVGPITTAPVGWALAGSATISTQSGNVAINAPADPDLDYITHTISAPSAGGKILVGVMMESNTADARFLTSGADATSDFRDVTLTATTSGTSAVMQYAIVQADASNTDIELRLGADAVGTAIGRFVGWWPLQEQLLPTESAVLLSDVESGTQAVTTSDVAITGLTVSSRLPFWFREGDDPSFAFTGRSIEVQATISLVATGAEDVVLQLNNGSTGIGPRVGERLAAGEAKTVHMTAIEQNVTDVTKVYTVTVLGANGSAATVNGTFAGETLSSSISAHVHGPSS